LAYVNWSIKFARVGGIDLKIHMTFLMFLAWIGFTYYTSSSEGTLSSCYDRADLGAPLLDLGLDGVADFARPGEFLVMRALER